MSYLPQTTEKKNKVLTEKQQSFLDNLIQTGGDPKKAAELAGYSGNYHPVSYTHLTLPMILLV